MSKKTNINVSKDKMFTDLHRLLETQNFKSEDELKNFLNNMMGAEIPSFPKEALSIKEQAQDLIFEAHESSITEGRKKAAEALKLDPDCIEAYEYLGTLENDVTKAMLHFQKGVDIGKRLFGGEFREENKGAFWMIHETRPYMRCQQHLADCFYGLGKIEESVALLEELIELNPNDNQGARDQLLLFLIVMGELSMLLIMILRITMQIGATTWQRLLK